MYTPSGTSGRPRPWVCPFSTIQTKTQPPHYHWQVGGQETGFYFSYGHSAGKEVRLVRPGPQMIHPTVPDSMQAREVSGSRRWGGEHDSCRRHHNPVGSAGDFSQGEQPTNIPVMAAVEEPPP